MGSLSRGPRAQSCWEQKFGAPRQGALAPDARGLLRLELRDGLDAEHATDGLEGYSHIWLIWLCSLNGHQATNSKVRVPRLRGGRAGIFATRTPFRPNPIGLSLVRLDRIDGATLHLSGIDLVNGTPVIDIKPYVPWYDAPRPLAGEQPPLGGVRVPSWVPGAESLRLEVSFTSAAEEALSLHSNHNSTRLLEGEALKSTLRQSLEADPRPLYRWRRQQSGKESVAEYELQVDGMLASCRFERNCDGSENVVVTSVARLTS
ncbi:hypothetical protein AB1Y20_023540 [Prymnesium parvum]|uniref:TsaA-like domain-containing protein n=1 Tax=Prymnesium parvum TaxID=97485 RepID=A0AB34JDM3_PRYPA|mmetsp:Transcript_5509/g.12184  ORF Transcript_5509/g.12184 Transcript_5509/m.12184 type:complete len:261 (-) Transcript_5509:126-908(-)